MKLFTKLSLLIFVVSVATTIIFGHTAKASTVETVPTTKNWKITFSLPVVESSLTNESVYVVNSKGEKQNVTFQLQGKVIYVNAPKEGYSGGETYELIVTNQLLGKNNTKIKPLVKQFSKPFKTEETFNIVNVSSDGASFVQSYQTFEQANNALQPNQAIMSGTQYIKISDGYVATSPKKAIIVYKNPAFKKADEYAGIMADSQLKYLDATLQYVKVEVAGQELYVKREDVTLIPTQLAKGNSYYTATKDGLSHSVYRPHAGKYDSAFIIGATPDFMTIGSTYYSTDGANFYDQNGNKVGQAYSYFQYVSLRVPTNYTAEQLDAYIMEQLKQRESLNPSKYKDASSISKIIGLGKSLKEVEKDYRINSLLLLAFAMHESDYGMSCHAQNNNNLFGFKVTDSAEKCKIGGNKDQLFYFPTVKANLEAVAGNLNSFYLNPNEMADFRYNGVALGNKMIGMNVRYASDPYWGEKIAGHLYRMDQALGAKDYKAYQIGFTPHPLVSVRVAPSTSAARAYQYRVDGTIKRLDHMPLTLSNTPSETSGWYRLISELPTKADDVYTVTDNVRIIDTY